MIRFRVLMISTLIAGALSSAAWAQSGDTNQDAHFEELLSRLQSDRFDDRESAAAEIEEIGHAMRPWIVRGAESSSLELRLRCQQLLKQIDRDDYQRLLSDFRERRSTTEEDRLPCWGEFRALFGDDSKARALYYNVAADEKDYLLTFEQFVEASKQLDPKLSDAERNARMSLKTRPIVDMLRTISASRIGPSAMLRPETLCVCIMIAHQPALKAHKGIEATLLGYLRDPSAVAALKRSPHFSAIRVGLSRWLSASKVDIQPLQAAIRLGLADVALDLGRKAIDAYAKVDSFYTDDASLAAEAGIVACGKFGDATDIDRLAVLLNKKIVVEHWVTLDDRSAAGQLRDLALAYSAHLAGKDAKELGFPHLESNHETIYSLRTISFTNDAQRDAAHEAWKTWRSAQLAGEKGRVSAKSGG